MPDVGFILSVNFTKLFNNPHHKILLMRFQELDISEELYFMKSSPLLPEATV